eukprot:CAMPEP_0117758642 /NCGR_PEP_ID=MMETSP0947-20121206/15511_1 /TAXON_ID=44440 /ORGANISM="Chattonella subsalsa, Strain CCMP2191" /LENGTH=367 /DNA_ID=CAMNT_0005578891 /DNA_START=115 /DNA_END=1218 /DNA_ORIENTATION=-
MCQICGAFRSPQMPLQRPQQAKARSPPSFLEMQGNADYPPIVPSESTVVVVGASGYIGKYVVQECVQRGFKKVVAVTRSPDQASEKLFDGAQVKIADVTDPESLKTAFDGGVDAVISCLASRSGIKKDSWLIDYQATLNSLDAARAYGAKHFVLLSAFCVRKPLLEFQHAKLQFEAALREADDITHSIVRPTAFFKSVSGQMEAIQNGSPFILFEDGSLCKCNPIAESDLAEYMVNCIEEPEKRNKILNLGGPDDGMTKKEQGDLMHQACGIQDPKYISFPIALFDVIIGGLDWFGQWFENFADYAEQARIGKYYAVEDMLTTKPEERYGKITLKQHFERIAVEGQEYDPTVALSAQISKFLVKFSS